MKVKLYNYDLVVLLQRYQQREKESGDLKRNYVDTLVEIKQKSGLKSVILEKKVADLKDSLERSVVENKTSKMTTGSTHDRIKAKQDMDELLEEKNNEIRRLRIELSQLAM